MLRVAVIGGSASRGGHRVPITMIASAECEILKFGLARKPACHAISKGSHAYHGSSQANAFFIGMTQVLVVELTGFT